MVGLWHCLLFCVSLGGATVYGGMTSVLGMFSSFLQGARFSIMTEDRASHWLSFFSIVMIFSSRTPISFFSAALLGIGICSAFGAEFTLIDEGKPRVRIELADPHSQVQQYAAEELQTVLHKMSGAEIAVLSATGEGAGAAKAAGRVVIGSRTSLPKEVVAQLAFTGQSDDEVVIKQIGGTLYIAGPTDQAALFAVYTFLERVGNVRWLWPGDSGERIPPASTVVMKDDEIRDAPGLRYRLLSVNSPHYDEPTQTWMARNRMNVDTISTVGTFPERYLLESDRKGFLVRLGGHNVVLPSALLKEHPEYIAQVQGKRTLHPRDNSHLCWSNKGVQDALVEATAAWVERYPQVDILSLFTADHNQYCECSGCIEMAKDVSTRWHKLSKILIERMKSKRPQLQFWTLAYDLYRPVPKEEAAPYDNIGYALYNGSYRHTLSSGHAANKVPLAEIRSWQEMGGKMGIRGYETVPLRAPGMFPLVYFIADELAYAQRNGFVSYDTEITPYGFPRNVLAEEQSWNVNRMNAYAVARGTWNPRLSGGAIVADWCEHAYGPAAKAMATYYGVLEDAWKDAPGDISDFLHPSLTVVDGFITEEVIMKGEEAFAAAWDALAAVDDPARKAEVAQAAEALTLDQKMFATWKKLYNLKRTEPSRYVAHSAELLREGASSPGGIPWHSIEALPALQASVDVTEGGKAAASGDTKAKTAATEVRTTWDNEALYVHFTCPETTGVASQPAEDGDGAGMLKGEHVEVMIDGVAGHETVRFAVNRHGARFSERLGFGTSQLNRQALPEWSAKTGPIESIDGATRSGWQVEVRIPLVGLQIAPLEPVRSREVVNTAIIHRDLAIAFKRVEPGTGAEGAARVTGWPDGRSYPKADYGLLKRYRTSPPKVVIYDNGEDDLLFATLKHGGWSAGRMNGGEPVGLALEQSQAVVMRYGKGENIDVSPKWMLNTLLPYVQNGGVLVISAAAELPLDKWFQIPELAVKWAGAGFAPRRISARVHDGAWQHTPHDFVKAFATRTTPLSSYIATGAAWKPLAELTMRDGQVHPYFLSARLGKGVVVLTSSALGYGGGYEMFGDRYVTNVALLLENLLAWNKSAQQDH